MKATALHFHCRVGDFSHALPGGHLPEPAGAVGRGRDDEVVGHGPVKVVDGGGVASQGVKEGGGLREEAEDRKGAILGAGHQLGLVVITKSD